MKEGRTWQPRKPDQMPPRDSQVHFKARILAWCCWLGTPKKGSSAFGSLSKQCQCRQGAEVVFDLSHLVGGSTHVIQTFSAPPRPDTTTPPDLARR